MLIKNLTFANERLFLTKNNFACKYLIVKYLCFS